MTDVTLTIDGQEVANSVFDHESDMGGLIRRTFATEISAGDGRTVDVRIVPYGERITHNDGLGGKPRGVDYQEEYLPGVFAHQVNAAHRVIANYEHGEGIGDIVARGVSLRESADGFHGTFRLLDNEAGNTMLELISQGAVDGVSVEARAVRNIVNGGLIQRAKAHLMGVAFTRFAAYKGARVLALREEAETTIDADLLPTDLDPELIKRMSSMGVTLPSRYEAHPETDTPADAGTPDESAPATPDQDEDQSEV